MNKLPNPAPCVFYVFQIGPKFFSHITKGNGMDFGLQVCRIKSALFWMNCYRFTLFKMNLSEKPKTMNKGTLKKITLLRHKLHQYPELSGQEKNTAKKIKSFFEPLKP